MITSGKQCINHSGFCLVRVRTAFFRGCSQLARMCLGIDQHRVVKGEPVQIKPSAGTLFPTFETASPFACYNTTLHNSFFLYLWDFFGKYVWFVHTLFQWQNSKIWLPCIDPHLLLGWFYQEYLQLQSISLKNTTDLVIRTDKSLVKICFFHLCFFLRLPLRMTCHLKQTEQWKCWKSR